MIEKIKEQANNISIILILIGIIGLLSSTHVEIELWKEIISKISIALITLGVSSLITKFHFDKYIKPDTNFSKSGILNSYMSRDELKKTITYENLIKRYNHVSIIGIKHSDITSKFRSLTKLIRARDKRFCIDIYFLSPTSSHRFLFERKLYKKNRLDLANEIMTNIISLNNLLDRDEELKRKVNIYVYDTIPIGNVIGMDRRKYIINHYQFFQKSVDSLWLLVDETGYGEKVRDFIDHVYEIKESIEYIDVIDDSGGEIGISKPRYQIHSQGDWHRTVHVWFMNNNGEILFQKRGNGVEVDPGKWDISCAGHIPSGKSSKETAVIEVFQELGIKIFENDLQFIDTIKKEIVINENYIDREFNDIYLVQKDLKISDFILGNDVEDVDYKKVSKLNNLIKTPKIDFVNHKREFEILNAHIESQNKKSE